MRSRLPLPLLLLTILILFIIFVLLVLIFHFGLLSDHNLVHWHRPLRLPLPNHLLHFRLYPFDLPHPLLLRLPRLLRLLQRLLALQLLDRLLNLLRYGPNAALLARVRIERVPLSSDDAQPWRPRNGGLHGRFLLLKFLLCGHGCYSSLRKYGERRQGSHVR